MDPCPEMALLQRSRSEPVVPARPPPPITTQAELSVFNQAILLTRHHACFKGMIEVTHEYLNGVFHHQHSLNFYSPCKRLIRAAG